MTSAYSRLTMESGGSVLDVVALQKVSGYHAGSGPVVILALTPWHVAVVLSRTLALVRLSPVVLALALVPVVPVVAWEPVVPVPVLVRELVVSESKLQPVVAYLAVVQILVLVKLLSVALMHVVLELVVMVLAVPEPVLPKPALSEQVTLQVEMPEPEQGLAVPVLVILEPAAPAPDVPKLAAFRQGALKHAVLGLELPEREIPELAVPELVALELAALGLVGLRPELPGRAMLGLVV
jgi:hypothetical protein